MKAILVRYCGPTDTRGAIMRSDDGDGNRFEMPYRGSRDSAWNHRTAARGLCRQMGWKGRLVGGSRPEGSVWVFTE